MCSQSQSFSVSHIWYVCDVMYLDYLCFITKKFTAEETASASNKHKRIEKVDKVTLSISAEKEREKNKDKENNENKNNAE